MTELYPFPTITTKVTYYGLSISQILTSYSYLSHLLDLQSNPNATSYSHANPNFPHYLLLLFTIATLAPLLSTAPHLLMEERVLGGDPSDEPSLQPIPSRANYDPIFRPKHFPSRKRTFKNSSVSIDFESETYVVQIPKEQVFSVPPPENAIIAERYRYQRTDKKESSCCKRFLCAFITLIVLALIIGVIIWTFQLLFSPQVPVFSIDQVNVKNLPSSSSSSKTTRLWYEIKFQAKNPNERMGISYSSNGDTTLLYRNSKIGTGKFPGLNQDAGISTNVQLGLTGLNGALPSDIETSIQDKKGKQQVSLSLRMNVPMDMNVGPITLWSKELDVVCNFKVSSLGAGKHVLSQQCQTKFK